MIGAELLLQSTAMNIIVLRMSVKDEFLYSNIHEFSKFPGKLLIFLDLHFSVQCSTFEKKNYE